MADSILDSIKSVLGISSTEEGFDDDLIMHINSVLADLEQLGVGPVGGFEIASKTDTWQMLIESEKTLNSVKTYVYLRVRLLFDPPATSFAIAAMEKQIEQHAWRIMVQVEEIRRAQQVTP